MPFVLRDVAHLVRLGPHPPCRRGQPEGVRQRLKYEIAAVRTVTVPAQRREREGRCRVVRQVEPAGQREALVAGIRQTFVPGGQQPLDLARRAGLDCQLADAGEIREFPGFLRQGLPPCRRGTAWIVRPLSRRRHCPPSVSCASSPGYRPSDSPCARASPPPIATPRTRPHSQCCPRARARQCRSRRCRLALPPSRTRRPR